MKEWALLSVHYYLLLACRKHNHRVKITKQNLFVFKTHNTHVNTCCCVFFFTDRQFFFLLFFFSLYLKPVSWNRTQHKEEHSIHEKKKWHLVHHLFSQTDKVNTEREGLTTKMQDNFIYNNKYSLHTLRMFEPAHSSNNNNNNSYRRTNEQQKKKYARTKKSFLF